MGETAPRISWKLAVGMEEESEGVQSWPHGFHLFLSQKNGSGKSWHRWN